MLQPYMTMRGIFFHEFLIVFQYVNVKCNLLLVGKECVGTSSSIQHVDDQIFTFKMTKIPGCSRYRNLSSRHWYISSSIMIYTRKKWT